MYWSVSSAESTDEEQSAYEPLLLAAETVDTMAAKATAKDLSSGGGGGGGGFVAGKAN